MKKKKAKRKNQYQKNIDDYEEHGPVNLDSWLVTYGEQIQGIYHSL